MNIPFVHTDISKNKRVMTLSTAIQQIIIEDVEMNEMSPDDLAVALAHACGQVVPFMQEKHGWSDDEAREYAEAASKLIMLQMDLGSGLEINPN